MPPYAFRIGPEAIADLNPPFWKILYTPLQTSGGSRIFLRGGGGGGGGGAKGRDVNNHGLGVATKYCALERKMYPGSGASPQPLFTVIMLLRRFRCICIIRAT